VVIGVIRMIEVNDRHGGRIVVTEDRGQWVSGVAATGDAPMEFVGGFPSYDAAHVDARRRYREARKAARKSRRSKK
jgi:hypothetical protein